MRARSKQNRHKYLSALGCLMLSFLLIGCGTSQNSISLSSQNTNMTKEQELASVLGYAPINAPIILPQALFSLQVTTQMFVQVSAIVDKEYTSALGTICRQAYISLENNQYVVAVCQSTTTEAKNTSQTNTEEVLWQLMPSINDTGLWGK